MEEYLLDLLHKMNCEDPLPVPENATGLAKYTRRTVRTETWKRIRVINEIELIEPLCNILSKPKIRAFEFDNGVTVLGYLLKNTSSILGRDCLLSLFTRKHLNTNRLTSLIFASKTANLIEAKDHVIELLLNHQDYSVLSYAADYITHIKNPEGIKIVGDLICQRKLGVAQVIPIGEIGEIDEFWLIPIFEKIIEARKGTRKGEDRDCVAYSLMAINNIKKDV